MMWLTVFVVLIISSIVIQKLLEALSEYSNFLKLYGIKLYGQTVIKHFWLFYIGMFVANFRNQVLPIVKKYWCVSLVISAFFYSTDFDIDLYYKLFRSLFLALGLIGFAYRFPKFAVPIDISYGIYLYHGIVLNLFVHLGLRDEWKYFLMVAFITVVIAFISTMTIGSFSTRHKKLEASSR